MQTAEEIAQQYSNHPTECERAILRHMEFHISRALEMAADMAADHRCDHSTCNCQGKIEAAIRALVIAEPPSETAE